MKVNWFSPLLPAKTAVAHDLLILLPYLQKKIDLTLWTSQKSWDTKLEKYASVKQYQLEKMPWFELNQGDINIYHIGNNADFHGDIWQISRLFPGIVILHDEKLQDFFYMLSPNRNTYIDYMKQCYGEEGNKNARLFLNNYHSMEFMAENYPLTSLALENALGVITHNHNIYLTLSQKNKWVTGYTPLPYISLDKENPKREKPSQKPYKLIIFGFIGKNRRLEQIFRALSQFEQKESFHLDIYGQLWDSRYLQQQIETLGLANLVTIHGFVSDEELNNALNNADLGINLRYPTMGEASGSQLRLWSHGLPSLVTKVGWYSSLKPSSVAFVRLDHEIEDIHRHLQGFLDRPQDYRQMGQEGKKILETDHHPRLYVESILDFVTKVREYRCEFSVDRMIQRLTPELCYLYSDEKEWNDPLEHISKAIEFISVNSKKHGSDRS